MEAVRWPDVAPPQDDVDAALRRAVPNGCYVRRTQGSHCGVCTIAVRPRSWADVRALQRWFWSLPQQRCALGGGAGSVLVLAVVLLELAALGARSLVAQLLRHHAARRVRTAGVVSVVGVETACPLFGDLHRTYESICRAKQRLPESAQALEPVLGNGSMSDSVESALSFDAEDIAALKPADLGGFLRESTAGLDDPQRSRGWHLLYADKPCTSWHGDSDEIGGKLVLVGATAIYVPFVDTSHGPRADAMSRFMVISPESTTAAISEFGVALGMAPDSQADRRATYVSAAQMYAEHAHVHFAEGNVPAGGG